MAKKRKTREQKKLADLRHTIHHNPSSGTYEIKLSTPHSQTPVKTVAISQNQYPYLKKDLSKTLFLTGAILAFQVALFFLFKNHIMFIPGLSY